MSSNSDNTNRPSIPTVVVSDAISDDGAADTPPQTEVVTKSLSQEILESASRTIEQEESEDTSNEAPSRKTPSQAETPVSKPSKPTPVFVAKPKPVASETTPVAQADPKPAAEEPTNPTDESKPAAVAETKPSPWKPTPPPKPAAIKPATTSEPNESTKLVAETTAAAAEKEANRTRFRDLPLAESVLKAVDKSGYEFPTQIQEQIIPHVLGGRDVMAQSQTGSGKTAAFALPILTNTDLSAKKPQALVLAPTRELAIQVAEAFETYASQMPKLSTVAIYGGQDYEVQFRKLRRGVQIVVGTPGRVIDHINRGTLDLSQLKTLVLDEADEMLNMGFLDDVEYVLDKSPGNRQVTLFSATFNDQIKKIAKRYLNDPVQVKIQRKAITAESIRQRAIICSNRDKMDLLIQMLEVEETDAVIVFTRTKDATITVAEQINRAGLRVAALNGDMPQKTRERTIERLKAGRLDIIVATDVAARGLDVTRVSHVINYDFPEGSESYIHRVGRTGRAGRKGEAILFLTPMQRGKLRMVERATQRKIEIVEPPSAKHLNAVRVTKLCESISQTIKESDLKRFGELIAAHAAETGESMEDIAAALAFLGQRGNEFFSTDRPKRARKERGERGGERGNRGRRGGPPAEGMTRYRIAVGRRDNVKPGNIVGAVTNEGGIEGQHIGPINIYSSHSTIDLPSGMPDDVHRILERTRVVGRELEIRKATAKDEIPEDRGGRRGGGGYGGGGRGRGFRSGGGGRDSRGGGGRREFRKRKPGGGGSGRGFAKVKSKKRRDDS